MCLKCAPAIGPAALRCVPARSPSVPGPGNRGIAGNRGIPGRWEPERSRPWEQGIPGRWELAVLRQEAAVYSPDVLQNPGMVWVGRDRHDHRIPAQRLSNLLKPSLRYCLTPFLALFLRDC